MLTLGIDDAGRGPLIGPMILAGVLLTRDQEKKLRGYSIKDSKKVIPSERIALSNLIKTKVLDYKIVKTAPKEIDDSENLNTLEAKKAAEIINSINVGKVVKEKTKVIIDCPSVNVNAWKSEVIGFIDHQDNITLVCEHKADVNHLSVSAASILAKVVREEEVEKIKKEYGEIGSGYPSDPATKEFLLKNGKKLKDSGIFRKSWSTWKKLFPEKGQATLSDF